MLRMPPSCQKPFAEPLRMEVAGCWLSPAERRTGMPVLHLEEVPADLYERIQQRAAAQNRPLTAEVIDLLRHALAKEDEDARAAHAAALADLRRRRWTPPPGTPESVELLREDRAR